MIELASPRGYPTTEAAGIVLCNQDEAGPYQTVPYSGECWEPEGEPARQPHEYVRHGTAKLSTLFRPATGEVRAKGVGCAPNTVRHPWVQDELTAILATLPEVTIPEEVRPEAAQWKTWLRRAPCVPPAAAVDPDLGQRRWASELGDGGLVIPAGGDAPLYAAVGVVAESGGGTPANHRAASTCRSTSSDTRGDYPLVGGHGCCMERGSHALCLGRQAQGATRPSPATSPGRLAGGYSGSPLKCSMTH
jgi:hypothetical protein